MSLALAHDLLGWPEPSQVYDPSGAGPGVLARIAREKLQPELARLEQLGVDGVRVGVLTPDPSANATGGAIAVVCEFARDVQPETIRQAHRLAWNFCRAPLLVTVEPTLLRTFTCFEVPGQQPGKIPKAEIREARIDLGKPIVLVEEASEALEWVNLVSGEFFNHFRSRFTTENRADQTLLRDLLHVRHHLLTTWIPYTDIVHDLLARLIFIQFLFDRKDASGQAALDVEKLRDLHTGKILSRAFDSFAEVLRSKDDTFAFFKWLNDRFNGDLFPGKGLKIELRDEAWREEIERIPPEALEYLALFVEGKTRMEQEQTAFWPLYSFDTIPLEFISSVYEEFVFRAKTATPADEGVKRDKGITNGVHYTRSHLVDFILDGVLPWNEPGWDLKVLDPACGSGIFLVKAFQRLVHRWRLANPGASPDAEVLAAILSQQLVGVDVDPNAVRVASFSMYLALCDELEPREITNVHFPPLRGNSLFAVDFFREDVRGLQTLEDARTYDLVIGNAPWGKGTDSALTEKAISWATDHDWDVSYGNIGPLFLAKAAILARTSGRVAMLQPALVLLGNRSGPVQRFRERLFATYKVEEIVNFSPLRRILFENAGAPACTVILRPTPPDGAPIAYVTPKPTGTAEDFNRVTLDPQDIHLLQVDDARRDPLVWTALMWGGRRDLELIRSFARAQSLSSLEKERRVRSREGFYRGDRKRERPFITGKPCLEGNLSEHLFLWLDGSDLDVNTDPATHSADSTDFSAFALPQLIIKQSWLKDSGRFSAARVHNTDDPVVCTQSYVSVTADPGSEAFLDAACLTYNSAVAVYYLLLTSGRFAFERAEMRKSEIMNVPIPPPVEDLMTDLRSYSDVDARVFERFSLKDPDRALIEDLVKYTLPDYKHINKGSYGRAARSPGRMPTVRSVTTDGPEPHLTAYCDYLLRVLEAGVGGPSARAAIFHDGDDNRLPLRMIAVYLDWPERKERITVESIGNSQLRDRLRRMTRLLTTQSADAGGVFYRRIGRFYDVLEVDERRIPVVYLTKPDQVRYWTRSMGLRDGDELSADLLWWSSRIREGEVMPAGGAA